MTIGCVDCWISAFSNSWISEACMAAPRAAREDGSSAVEVVEGERMLVLGAKRDVRMRAILGVWEVPPDMITYSLSKQNSLNL